ncbi:MAG: glycosyltransferase family 1 protein [Caldilineales bacterium]|nr:glycosyltransferase family 1 protein [Caldilineales bacterium]
MSYRIQIVTTLPGPFLQQFYDAQPALAAQPYAEQLQALLVESVGWSDAYALNFRAWGHEAETLIVNAAPLQRQWAKEHGLGDAIRQLRLLEAVDRMGQITRPLRGTSQVHRKRLQAEIFLQQVKRYRPDILFVQLQTPLSGAVLKAARQHCRVVIAQLASRFPAYSDLFDIFDLIITAFPHYERFFNDCGLRSVYLPLAFEPIFLQRVRARYGADAQTAFDAVFIGSISTQHRQRLHWLNALADSDLVDIWLSFDGPVDPSGLSESLRRCLRPPVYGLEMYDIYRRARIALNSHPEISGPYAAIMRMYEITGSGALLLTDERQDIADLFIPGQEIVTYSHITDCLDKLKYFIDHEQERAKIAKNGQEKTLSAHRYAQRAAFILEQMQKLCNC